MALSNCHKYQCDDSDRTYDPLKNLVSHESTFLEFITDVEQLLENKRSIEFRWQHTSQDR